MGKLRRKHSAVFKAKVVQAAMAENETMAELNSKYGIHPNQITKWKSQAEEILKAGFNKKNLSTELKEKDRVIEDLYRKIGKLEYSLDWLKKRWGLTNEKKRELVENNNVLSKSEQIALLQLNRSTYYYKPVEVNEYDKYLLNRIDEIYTRHPFYGYRPITEELKATGDTVNHKKVLRLTKVLGISAVVPKKSTSKSNQNHEVSLLANKS